jgi:serralysin
MALDIAALQFMYGVDTTSRTGNDTYTLPGANRVGTFYSCIWDAGGTDTVLGASALGNTIDLRAATLQVGPGGGGFVSYASGIHGGFTIAKGAVIENATGGNLQDRITGNQVANVLVGLGGNDVLRGGAGRDTLTGGTGSDDFVFRATSDSAPSSTTRDIISGGFSKGSDDIVVSGIDAKAGLSGNQAFALDTNASFSAGEIRQKVISSGLLVEFNTDSDSTAEMVILIQGMTSKLGLTDFVF